MPTPGRHFKEELQEWLDQQLDAQTRAEVERHLETCAECRREFETLRWTKQFAAKQFAAAEAPAELRKNILQALKPCDHASDAETRYPLFWKTRRRSILAWAVIVAAAAILAFTYFLKQPKPPDVVAQNYRAYQAQRLPLQLNTSDAKQMEKFFSAHGVPFATRVFDLGMMNYRLVGGRVQPIRHQPSALFFYLGPAGHILLCQMYAGKVTELPSGAVRREHNGIKFYIYQRNGLTTVFWQEGAVTCVLISNIESEQVIQLAFAKAMTI